MQSENSELERQVEVLTKMRAKERGGDTETVKREIGGSRPAFGIAHLTAKIGETATYNSKINAMNSSLTSTNQSIASLQGRMAQLRQQTSGSHSLSSESHILAQQLKSSESRLDKATERYNELLTNNRKLRDSITSVRHELAAYSGAWRKLDKEAAEVKKRMADLVLATNEANAARDASQIRLLRLKEVQSREREAYEREMRELQRKKEADAKLRQFLAEKIAERKEKRIELERERRELDKGVSGSIAVLHQIRTLRETVDLYAEVLEELRDMVAAWEGLDKNAAKKLEAKELLQRFAALEHRSFSLFSYVNELAMKAANYRAKLAVMRDEIKAAEQKRAERNQGTEEKRDKLEVRFPLLASCQSLT